MLTGPGTCDLCAVPQSSYAFKNVQQKSQRNGPGKKGWLNLVSPILPVLGPCQAGHSVSGGSCLAPRVGQLG